MASSASRSRMESGIKLAEFRERLRKILPERVNPWLEKRLAQGGLIEAEAKRQAKKAIYGFQPGDIVTTVMSFGSAAPIAVRVIGPDLQDGPPACREDRRQNEEDPVLARHRIRAAA